MKARPAPLESMVIIVERSAMHIRSGPVRALFPKTNSKRSFINLSTLITPRRQSYSHPRFALPSNALRSAMNNYWMTNNAMQRNPA
jgi:hypothetical protein